MTAGNLQHISLAMCYNFLTLLVVWQTSQRQNKRRKWRGRSLAPNLQCVVFTLWCGYKWNKKMHFNHSCPLKVFRIHLTVIMLRYLAFWFYWFFCLWTTFTWSKLACLVLTHNRESCSIALASLSTVLVLCDAAVGGQSVFLLHFWDIQGAKRGQEETVTWQKYRGGMKKQRW